MLNATLVVATKEIVDGMRDVRAIVSSLLYLLMGPVVVLLVSVGIDPGRKGSAEVIGGMLSVFTLVAAFVGGMNIAMDTIAGERERRSLLPLLLNPLSRRDVAAGKWLAVSFFALCGLIINGLASLLVGARAGLHGRVTLGSVLAIAALPLLAAALQLLISTLSRGVKEAHTYLSLATFLPMGIGMFLVFSPALRGGFLRWLPLAGQQMEVEALFSGGATQPLSGAALACFTVAASIALMLRAAKRLERDDVVYGD